MRGALKPIAVSAVSDRGFSAVMWVVPRISIYKCCSSLLFGMNGAFFVAKIILKGYFYETH